MGKRLFLKRNQMILTKTAAILSIIIFALTVTFGSFAFAEGENLAELAAQVKETEAEITKITNEKNALNEQIDALGSEIDRIKRENQDLTARLAADKEEMEERLRAMYMHNGSDDYIEILFSSESFADFISRAEMIISVYKADRSQLDEMTAIQAQLQKNNEKLESDRASLQDSVKALVQQETELTDLLTENKTKLQNAQIAAVSASSGENYTSAVSSDNNSTQTVNDGDFDLICAIVRHEAGASYEGALAVISCVMNRVDVGGWYGSDAVSVLTKPYQFESYTGGYYKQYLGAEISETRRAVRDCMEGGVRSHNYLSFRSAWYFEDLGYFPEGINIYGNYYFNAKD